MNRISPETRIHRHLIDALYIEAMLLADEARSYFDEVGRAEREMLDPLVRVGFSCESLKVTTRLMHVIAWLLTAARGRRGGAARSRCARSVAAAGGGHRCSMPIWWARCHTVPVP